jgi:hypothetical protein
MLKHVLPLQEKYYKYHEKVSDNTYNDVINHNICLGTER